MNESLKTDLDKFFTEYSLVDIPRKEIRKKAKASQPITINTGERVFSFALEPKHLRSRNLKLEVITEEGIENLERKEGVTFRGTLMGNPESEVRLMIDEKKISGYIFTGTERFFLSSASNYSKHASPQTVVVYLSEHAITEPVEMQPAITIQGLQQVTTEFNPPVAAANQLRVIELATDADFAFVSRLGGVEAANNYILSVVNMVDGLYESELGLSITVTHQNAWAAQDPYTPNNGGDLYPLLSSVQNFWNSNKPISNYPRDVVHLFTGRWQGAGLAYMGSICQMPSFSYGVSAFCGGAFIQSLVMAHEIGHNLSADHTDTGECVNSVMNSVLSGSVRSFCQPSRNTITGYVSRFGSCLGAETVSEPVPPNPAPAPPPTPYVPPVQEPTPVPPTVEPEPPIYVPPVNEPAPPVNEPAPPVNEPAPPYTPPVVKPEPAPPVNEPAPPVNEPAPPYTPPVVKPEPAPPVNEPTPIPPVAERPPRKPSKKKKWWKFLFFWVK